MVYESQTYTQYLNNCLGLLILNLHAITNLKPIHTSKYKITA